MNRNKEIWEGWTVGDFIDELNITFETAMWMFNSTQDVKEWVISEQPYYKKNIPEVTRYFINKYEESI